MIFFVGCDVGVDIVVVVVVGVVAVGVVVVGVVVTVDVDTGRDESRRSPENAENVRSSNTNFFSSYRCLQLTFFETVTVSVARIIKTVF